MKLGERGSSDINITSNIVKLTSLAVQRGAEEVIKRRVILHENLQEMSIGTFHILLFCVVMCTVICLSFCLKVASFVALLPVLAACHTFLLFACNYCIGE